MLFHISLVRLAEKFSALSNLMDSC